MNSFVRHITGPGERIILLARLHWIYLVKGLLWMAALSGFGKFLDLQLLRNAGATIPLSIQELVNISLDPGLPILFFFLGSCGAVIFLSETIKMLATEIALTNQRLIFKTGLIFVQVEEIDLEEIRAENVNHGILGRFLGYGRVHLDSRFVGDIHLPAVKNPYRLIKAMHARRGKIRDPLADQNNSTATSIDQIPSPAR